MAVNVFGVIIPNQKKITASLLAGRAARPGARRHRQAALGPQQLPDAARPPDDGERPLSDALRPPAAWLVVALIIVIGGAARHFLNRHDAGDPLRQDRLDAAGRGGRRSSSRSSSPRRATDSTLPGSASATARCCAIVGKHCVMCHSARPSHEASTRRRRASSSARSTISAGIRTRSWPRRSTATPCRSATRPA